jgi:hypothetical protein
MAWNLFVVTLCVDGATSHYGNLVSSWPLRIRYTLASEIRIA